MKIAFKIWNAKVGFKNLVETLVELSALEKLLDIGKLFFFSFSFNFPLV